MAAGAGLSWYDAARIYAIKTAWSVGVPERDVEDAAHDILIRLWRRGLWGRSMQSVSWQMRQGAIDAVRVYGRHSRRGVERASLFCEVGL